MKNEYYRNIETAVKDEKFDLGISIDKLSFTEDGLIPVIAQQHDTGEVLMMAWMNKESIQETLRTKHVCYWSRSRQSLWRKGESSGNIQTLIELRIDCDGDTLLCLVDQQGPACHTDRTNCFYLRVDEKNSSIIVDSSQPSKQSPA